MTVLISILFTMLWFALLATASTLLMLFGFTVAHYLLTGRG